MAGEIKIRETSPLAEGMTINIRPQGDRWNLRVWLAGSMLEDSHHDTPSDAVKRIAGIAMQHFGSELVGGILGDLIRGRH